MKKSLLLLFAALALFGLATSGFGQPSVHIFYYFDDGVDPAEPPLGCPCDTGPGYEDGTSICFYWDNDHNGPDADDPQPPAGQVPSLLCTSFNGDAQGIGSGYFAMANPFTINILPSVPDSCWYYLRVNAGGCCYESITYQFTPGPFEHFMARADWTCANEECEAPPVITPNEPTNVEATDDTGCLSIHVTWEHDGQNLTGFRIYDQNGIMTTISGQLRERSVPVVDNQLHQIYVTAINVTEESDESNTDDGSSLLLNFADGAAGNISGVNQGGTTHTIRFVRGITECASFWQLWLINPDGSRYDSLTADTLQFPEDPDSVTFTLPTGTASGLRLLVDAYAVSAMVSVADTSDSTFTLGPVGADDPVVIPQEFSLAQNFPNPFNPETRIEFAVPYQSDVKIEIYNIAGQLVTTLLDGSITAGVHHIAWNGRSSGGIDVSSGLYLYRMTGPGFVQTKKMLMLK